MAVSLIEKIARALSEAAAKAVDQNIGMPYYNYIAQAALTAIQDAGDGVQEVDREAAKSLLGRDDAGPSWWSIDSGNADSDAMVQAFVRHRALERARIVAVLRELTWSCADDMTSALRAADAIERGEV